MIRHPRRPTPFPYTPPFRPGSDGAREDQAADSEPPPPRFVPPRRRRRRGRGADRKSTRLNSSHANISYAVFCLKKKNSMKRYTIVTIACGSQDIPKIVSAHV